MAAAQKEWRTLGHLTQNRNFRAEIANLATGILQSILNKVKPHREYNR
jgi:hypothetical protein